jgi:hypothetical protein
VDLRAPGDEELEHEPDEEEEEYEEPDEDEEERTAPSAFNLSPDDPRFTRGPHSKKTHHKKTFAKVREFLGVGPVGERTPSDKYAAMAHRFALGFTRDLTRADCPVSSALASIIGTASKQLAGSRELFDKAERIRDPVQKSEVLARANLLANSSRANVKEALAVSRLQKPNPTLTKRESFISRFSGKQ